jgi:hypothetical protein
MLSRLLRGNAFPKKTTGRSCKGILTLAPMGQRVHTYRKHSGGDALAHVETKCRGMAGAVLLHPGNGQVVDPAIEGYVQVPKPRAQSIAPIFISVCLFQDSLTLGYVTQKQKTL